jgi:hypothetical protein
MNKLAVLVDIDDTIADAQTVLLEHVNLVSPTKYHHRGLTRAFRERDDNDYNRLVGQLLKQPDIVGSYQPFGDALDAMAELHQAGYAVHIASSRKEDLHAVTLQWLRRHGFADYVTQVHPRSSASRGHIFKVETATRLQAVAAFDDTFNVVEALSAAVPVVYLIERPWNQGEATPVNVKRASSFAAAVNDFLIVRH